uniref:Putative secreted protein n=1 Tax=Anopheles darlingi TaxID=43151 RepID=A0A2M4D746_ANODA
MPRWKHQRGTFLLHLHPFLAVPLPAPAMSCSLFEAFDYGFAHNQRYPAHHGFHFQIHYPVPFDGGPQ